MTTLLIIAALLVGAGASFRALIRRAAALQRALDCTRGWP